MIAEITATKFQPRAVIFPCHPFDSCQDIRSEMLAAMAAMGVTVEKHHHEVASAQHELGIKIAPIVQMADQLQIYKYCIHNVAQAYGKTQLLCLNQFYGDNALACIATCQSGKMDNRFSQAINMQASSDTCLYYIGGVIKHAKAINAFTKPNNQLLQTSCSRV